MPPPPAPRHSRESGNPTRPQGAPAGMTRRREPQSVVDLTNAGEKPNGLHYD
ncbi:MAG: hypothetical protein ACR2P4_05865 [Gammaproteobacteria bacterium]